jgi:hypothetical protein
VRNKYANTAGMPVVEKPIASAYATSIYQGDPVKMTTDGTLQLAAPADAVYGIFLGMKQVYSSTLGAVAPAGAYLATVTYGSVLSRQSIARVVPVRGQVFRVTCDDATTATTQAAYEAFMGENCEFATGTASGDRSGLLLDISSHANTATLTVRIEDVPDKEITNFAGTGVELEVIFNVIQDVLGGSATGLA